MIADETTAMDQAKPALRNYRSDDELEIRDALEVFCRARWPKARIVHELVMDRGSVRADMAAIDPTHLVSFEIKSKFDVTARLLNQACMFRLATPETWIVVDQSHERDAKLVRYLLPTVGVAVAVREKMYGGPFRIEVRHEAVQFAPHPEALLSLCWVAELHSETVRARLTGGGKAGSHKSLVTAMSRLTGDEQIAAVCRQLRAREALWRADPAIPLAEAGAA